MTLTHRAPRSIIAGDSIKFLVAIPDGYAGWEGSARITGPSQADVVVDIVDTDYQLYLSDSASADLSAGQYVLTLWATTDGERKTIAQFPISVTANLAEGEPSEPHCVKMLRIIEAAIEARVTGNADGGLDSYMIGDTSVTKVPLEQLQIERKRYAAEVAATQNPNGGIGRVKFVMSPGGGIPDMRRRFG